MVKNTLEETGPFKLEVLCSENCERPMITLQQLVNGLQAEVGEEQGAALIEAAMGGFFSTLDETTKALVFAQLQGWLATIGSDPEPQVPKVGLGLTSTIQGLGLFEAPDIEQPAPAKVEFHVAALLGAGCNPERASFKPVQGVPGLATGSYADYRITSCTVVRAQQFAEVLNNLALVNLRSPWTGKRTLRTYDSEVDPDNVIEAMVTAGQLRAKWHAEAAAANMPAEGYGLLGVCNDSTAVIERKLHGETTIFPLSHPAVQGEQTDWDEIDILLDGIPGDIDPENLASDALSRIKTTLPWENSEDSPFPAFRAVVDGL